MRESYRSPLFRCLICLILVCCILVNVSPIRAKAFAGLSLPALMYLLYAAAVGAVIIPSGIAIANSIGQKVDDKVKVSFAPEMLEVWNRMCDRYDGWVPEWDPEEWHDDLKHGLAGGLLALIGSMMVELIVEGAIHMTEKDLSDGSWLMDSIDLTINNFSYSGTSSVPFCGIFYHYKENSNSYHYGFLGCSGNLKPTVKFNNISYSASIYNGFYIFGVTSSSSSSTVPIFSSSPTVPFISFPDGSSLDDVKDFLIEYYNNGQTITIEPDIYVGDLPDEIRNGEKDEDNINLPIIDPFKIIQSPETAFEDVTKTLQDLKDSVITYDEYMEMVTADEPTVDPDPSDPTDPSEDPEDIPEEIAPYTFDLRKIFPFCIPFDLYDFLTCLDATPVAPVINWQIQLPGGSTYPLTVDLSAFDSVAQLLRRLELLVFSIALAIKTRDLIKG